MKAWHRWPLGWFGQAALIVLPVVILSGIALSFVREDRAAIEQEAKNRAVELAPYVAWRLGEHMSALLDANRNTGLFTQGEVIPWGQVRALPDYTRLPTPAQWPARLSASDAQLWSGAQDAVYRNSGGDFAKRAFTVLAQSGHDPALRANARLALLIADEPHTDAGTLIQRGLALAKQDSSEVTESGTQVSDLALLIALRHASTGDVPPELLGAIDSNISHHPSWLSTELLDAVARHAASEKGKGAVARLRARWQMQEDSRGRTREIMHRLSASLRAPVRGPIIIEDWPSKSFAFCTPRSTGWHVTLVPAVTVYGVLGKELPDYMSATINPQRLRSVPLARAKGTVHSDAKYPFQLALDLRKTELLYAPYRRRLLVIQWLIVLAGAAALLGLWRLWNTYRDQTRLTEMKSNLVSSVSHELRAPIAAVRLMAESLESGRIDGAEKQRDYSRLIVRECRRLSSLVENVLDFSRIDQGRKQYHFEPLDTLALVRHTVMLMEPCAAERKVELRLAEPPAEFQHLQPSWDSEAVEQSMVNLLDNAIKHSPPSGEVLVSVELLPAQVRIWVADQGPGIPLEEQQKIFGLFYRYGSELRRETQGVGIGLSIVKHVAEAHGGKVLVESKPGHGSRFGLELPR